MPLGSKGRPLWLISPSANRLIIFYLLWKSGSDPLSPASIYSNNTQFSLETASICVALGQQGADKNEGMLGN